MRWLALVLLLPAIVTAGTIPDRYDDEFRAEASRWMPAVDWRLLKAQCYQESLLRPRAVSPVGAKGLCQFMPGTWDQVTDSLGLSASVYDPYASITAAAYYMARLRHNWSAPRPESDRHSLALASYNAGFGHLLDAQRRCGGANLYSQIVPCLPEVTGEHAKETKTYVRRTWHHWMRLQLGF